jgi:cytoskeleton-associated protein 5
LQLLDVIEDTVAALKHNNPKVRQETLKFLLEAIRTKDDAHAKKLQAPLLPTLAKAADEPTPALRDAAMLVLAEFAAKAGSMAPLEKATAGLDDTKKKKLAAMARARISGEDPSAATSAAVVKEPPVPSASTAAAASRPSTAPASRSRPGASGMSSSGKPSKSAVAAPSSSSAQAETQDDPVALASSAPKGEEAVQRLSDAAGDAAVAPLRSAAWKERLDAINGLLERVPEICATAGGADALVFGVASLPGWGEKNFQVLGKAFELCGAVAGIPGSGFGKVRPEIISCRMRSLLFTPFPFAPPSPLANLPSFLLPSSFLSRASSPVPPFRPRLIVSAASRLFTALGRRREDFRCQAQGAWHRCALGGR